MCTAISYRTKDFYFGRTLDYDHSFSEEVLVTPRKFPFVFRHMGAMPEHYAMIGMGCVSQAVPLYFDAVNEKGLGMAGLNFVGNAAYRDVEEDKENVAHFELIPWVLSQCASVLEARSLLAKLNITNVAFSRELPPAGLHWFLGDRQESLTVEATAEGLQVYDNPVGVLTNNPPFPQQLFQLNNFMHLSPDSPENHFSRKLPMEAYSRGMGALGLPGDFSSQSRFVRASFVKLNSVSDGSEEDSVSQFFRILDTVSQPKGCCRVGEGRYETTIYASCCNADKGIYYYTTARNRRVTGVSLHRERLDSVSLIRYPLVQEQQVHILN